MKAENEDQTVDHLLQVIADLRIRWQQVKAELAEAKGINSTLEISVTTLYLEIEYLRSQAYSREIESLRSELENLRGY